MVIQLRRPILIGGLGLTFGAWLLDSFYPIAPDLNTPAVWGAIAVGSGIWWWRHRPQTAIEFAVTRPAIDQSAVERALAAVTTRLGKLEAELNLLSAAARPTAIEQLAQFQQRLTDLTTAQARQNARLSIMGSKATGKTTLFQLLVNSTIQDATLAPDAPVAEETAVLSVTDAIDSDLVVFLTAGDLTQSDLQTIQQLAAQNHRVLLVLSKHDQYLPADRPVLLQQLRDRVKGLIPVEDVVSIAASPALYKVRQHQADGSIQERVEQPEPDLAALQERLEQVLTQQGQTLIWATTVRQAQLLERQVQSAINQLRRDRAMPLVEQYQWIAAAAAFANPVPSLDLLATASVNTQLVMDLSAIYQQPVSLQQAKTVTTTLASQMLKLGLVELSTQAIAPLLKGGALTYVAGGTLQGFSAAYLTYVAGLSLVEYFEEQSWAESSTGLFFQADRLLQKLKLVFQDNQRSAFLQNLVRQGVDRLKPVAVG